MEKIIKQATANAKQRLKLLDKVRDAIDNDPAMRKAINKADGSFIRKIYGWPGDITTHRIATVLTKAGY